VEFSVLASQQDPFDPMERAPHEMGERFLAQTEHLHRDWSLIREYPLSPQLLALSHVWRSPSEDDYFIEAKGSPEAAMDLCHPDEERKEELLMQVNVTADDGLCVLGWLKHISGKTRPCHANNTTFSSCLLA
jgi:Ca2+-transporting ATPase